MLLVRIAVWYHREPRSRFELSPRIDGGFVRLKNATPAAIAMVVPIASVLSKCCGELMAVFDPAPSAVTEFSKSDNRSWWILAVGLILGLIFLWPPYVTRMWNAEHYQFFVFVLAAVAWLLWSRQPEIAESRSTPRPTVVLVSWLGIVFLIAAGNVGYSHSVGSFAGIVINIFAIICGVYTVYGWRGLRSASGVLWLLGFAVPLPLSLDRELIMAMQMLASDLASRLLDGTGVIHFRQGVIIETPTAKYLTEEACSGVRSLFSSLALVAIYGVWTRHRRWRIVINLVQAVIWVLIGNSIRVALVVAFADSFPAIATGWGHELLGMAVFGFILAMVASTDAAVSRWISDRLVIDTRGKSSSVGDQKRVQLPPFPISGLGSKVLFIALGVTVIIALRTAWVRQAKANFELFATFASIDDPHEDDFNRQYNGYTKQSFNHVKRERRTIWAKNSFVYEFKRGHLNPVLSIDRPWNEWHDLHICYSSAGWESSPRYALSPKVGAAKPRTSQHKYSELTLKRSGRYGVVIFSAIDRLGEHVPERVWPISAMRLQSKTAMMRVLSNQILARLGVPGYEHQYLALSALLPVSTIQVYAESPEPWNEEELESLREFFFVLREEIVVAASRQE